MSGFLTILLHPPVWKIEVYISAKIPAVRQSPVTNFRHDKLVRYRRLRRRRRGSGSGGGLNNNPTSLFLPHPNAHRSCGTPTTSMYAHPPISPHGHRHDVHLPAALPPPLFQITSYQARRSACCTKQRATDRCAGRLYMGGPIKCRRACAYHFFVGPAAACSSTITISTWA
jgi:hypothetical protein